MPDFATLTPLSLSVLILLSVALLKSVISQLAPHEPLSFFQFYCQRLADKVNKTSNSSGQQTIAGLVAIVITLTPLLIILWLFEAFVEVNWLWQGLLLYFAFGPFNIGQQSSKMAQAITANQKYQARQLLDPWVLRDTDQLSNLGICKASIEMQLLRSLQQGFVVACLFLSFGALSAIAYRLLLEMHYSWNAKRQGYSAFGLRVAQLVLLIQWLPSRLFSIILMLSALGQNIVLHWRLLKGEFFRLNNDLALHALALCLEVRLGGVAMYNKVKLRKNSFNDQARQPEAKDIMLAISRLRYVNIISLTLLILMTFASQFLSGSLS